MEFLKNVAKGFGWGIGFAIGLTLVLLLVSPFIPDSQERQLQKAINNALKAEELSAIEITNYPLGRGGSY